MNIDQVTKKISRDKYKSRFTGNSIYDPLKFRFNLNTAKLFEKIFNDFIKEQYPDIKIDNTSTTNLMWHIRYYFNKTDYFNCKINIFSDNVIKIEFFCYTFKFHNWSKALNFLINESDNYINFLKMYIGLIHSGKHLTLRICKEYGLNDFNLSHDITWSEYYFNPKKNGKYII